MGTRKLKSETGTKTSERQELTNAVAGETVGLLMRELGVKPGKSKIRQILDKSIGGEEGVKCPNCGNNGHSHALKLTGNGTLKCSGSECNSEFALIPTEVPEYSCDSCGSAHHKGKDELTDKCVFCGDNHFTKKNDYSRIRDRVTKRNQNKKGIIGKVLGD